ncbi:hypothetical protein Hypma_001029 [Hypsizygus marmoreus]|uniref:Uncharacterized protein n=1 Tax=Hypsizygus marmoreus TaxID=39966 RepID=A0A369JFE2_HYPMA|nr:hypothetical protein Hypma_001029 [Hypsizygus marmoreus]
MRATPTAAAVGRAAHPDAPEQKLAGTSVYTPSAISAHGENPITFLGNPDMLRPQQSKTPGQPVENRARFGLEALKAVTEVFDDNVAIKLSPAGGYNDVGMLLQELLTRSTTSSLKWTRSGQFQPVLHYTRPYNLEQTDVEFDGRKAPQCMPYLDLTGPSSKNAKIFITAGVTPEEGAALVASGNADGVVIGFAWITHPTLPTVC